MGGRELALPAQQEDEDGEGEDVREGVQHELVDVVAVGLQDVPDEVLNKLQPVFYTDPMNASIRAMGLE